MQNSLKVSETPIKLDYGEDQKKVRIATIASPFGSLSVDLTFRTNMVIDRYPYADICAFKDKVTSILFIFCDHVKS